MKESVTFDLDIFLTVVFHHFQRERYLACSRGQLSFVPATGYRVHNGIMKVTLDLNIKGMSYLDVSNEIMSALYLDDIEREHTIFVMPDSVEFGSGAAYGENMGTLSWFMSFVASYPIVQVRFPIQEVMTVCDVIVFSHLSFGFQTKVHELGHNLGHAHSGSASSAYGDSTCMMGLFGDVSGDGYKCFNPAKTWYNSWFEEHHGIVYPLQQGYDGSLVGLDDITNNRISHSQHAVVKVDSSGTSGMNSNDLFLMFSRKEGINKDVPGIEDNRVIVTEQIRDGSPSVQVASLGSGESYVQQNWHKGKPLVIKNCALQRKGFALSSRVLVYYKGAGELSCDDIQLRSQGLSNKCITEKNGSLVMRTCEPLVSQRWHMDGNGHIRSSSMNNRCIMGENGSTEKGSRLVLGPCKDGKQYRFIISSGKIKPLKNRSVCIGKKKESNRLEFMPCSMPYTRWREVAFSET